MTDKKVQSRCDKWNAQNLVGTEVVVKKDDGTELKTSTRSVAWVLGGHTAVIMVDGISGCYDLSRVSPVVYGVEKKLKRDLVISVTEKGDLVGVYFEGNSKHPIVECHPLLANALVNTWNHLTNGIEFGQMSKTEKIREMMRECDITAYEPEAVGTGIIKGLELALSILEDDDSYPLFRDREDCEEPQVDEPPDEEEKGDVCVTCGKKIDHNEPVNECEECRSK